MKPVTTKCVPIVPTFEMKLAWKQRISELNKRYNLEGKKPVIDLFDEAYKAMIEAAP